MKKLILSMAAVLILLLLSGNSSASMHDHMGGKHSRHTDANHSNHLETTATRAANHDNHIEAPGKAVDAGNKICPVMEQKINDKYKVTYEYKGKIYNFCCAACIGEFKKNPAKYIQKIESGRP